MLKETLFSVLLLAGMANRCSAVAVKALVGGYERITILVIEVDRTSGCPVGTSPCKLHIAGRVTRVVNDASHHGGLLGGFEADIRQIYRGMIGVGEPGWLRTHAETGRQYILGADPKQALISMVQDPVWVGQVPDNEDFAGDLELMIASAHLSLADQASAVAAALAAPTIPRSGQLAQYAVALLAEAPSSDTAVLSQAIEQGGRNALSPSGKSTLLWCLWSEVRDQAAIFDRVPADNLLHLLITATARYFLEAPNSPEADLRLAIIRNELPWILSSGRAKEMIRTELSPALAEQFRQRALKEKDGGDARFSAADRETLKRLAEFIGEPRR